MEEFKEKNEQKIKQGIAQENKYAKYPPIREEVINGIPPIDFDFNDYELSKWHENWSVKRYGADSLDCSKYYKNYADGDRFVTDGTPKVGDEVLLKEKAERDRVLELLIKIRHLTRQLKGIGLKDFPTLQERQQKQEERKKYYDEFLAIVKDEYSQVPKALNTDSAKSILQKAINAGFCDTNYQWKKTKALLAYFADKASEYLELGKGEYDGKAKTSWKPFESLFGISGLSGAKRDYQKTGTLPDGYKDVDNLF